MKPIGVVLAGGMSTRMGRDKALLQFNGRSLMQHMRAVLLECCEQVWISGRPGDGAMIPDQYPGRGPVGAIHAVCISALAKRISQPLLIVPVDMPLLSLTHVEPLLASHAAVCSYKDYALPAVIHDVELVGQHAESLLQSSHQKAALESLWQSCEASRPTLPSAQKHQFINTNTPEQWHQLLAGMAGAVQS